FEVAVTGTRFSLAWDPAHETLELSLTEGSVEVRGGGGSGPWVVRAGQRFHGDMHGVSMVVSEAEPRHDAPSGPLVTTGSASGPSRVDVARGAASAATAEPAAVEPPSAPAPAGAKAPAKHDGWDQHIARGEFAQIVQEAEARGTAGCLVSCSAS